MEAEILDVLFQAKEFVGHQKLEEVRRILPESLQRECDSAVPLISDI